MCATKINGRLGAAAGVVALLVLSLLLTACSQEAAGPTAPLFELTNQHGQTTRLDKLEGRVVVLTFLYTHCPDTCPMYVSKLGQAMLALEDNALEKVAVVVVTVDPERDTVERLSDYAAYLPPGWQFLTGTPGQLRTMWENYDIFVQKQEQQTDPGSHQGHAEFLVIHTAKVVLIDGEGFLRSELTGDWEVSELVDKISLLLSGGQVSGNGVRGLVAGLLHRCGPFVFNSIGSALLFYFAMFFMPAAAIAGVGFYLLRS
ncbi:MAG: SCO family protein [Dehalococcoidia bacterium]|jgi:protein SCO1/2|nr:SCO family protein [Dehalococcoidia bacterium]